MKVFFRAIDLAQTANKIKQRKAIWHAPKERVKQPTNVNKSENIADVCIQSIVSTDERTRFFINKIGACKLCVPSNANPESLADSPE